MYYCVLDFEANCTEDGNRSVNEIIEFPCIILKQEIVNLTEVARFESFVKPRDNPIITPFCTNLTTIKQTDVDNAPQFDVVFKNVCKWISQVEELESVTFNNNNFVFVTCGNWDLNKMLSTDLKRWNITSVRQIFKTFINIKAIYAKLHTFKPHGMMQMLNRSGIEHVGTHHRGIDDCVNIAQILRLCILKGYVFSTDDVVHVKALKN
jgi:ERI1 exoribonuclease 3